MNETTETVKRPLSITVICLLGFLGGLIAVPLVFSTTAQQIGSWYPPYSAVSTVTGLACLVGLWMMKKWAAYTYTGYVILNQVVLFTMDVYNISALLLPAIVVFFPLKHVSKMT